MGWFLLVVAASFHAQSLGYDFSANIWRPAAQLLHGHGMYPAHVGTAVPQTVSVNPPLLAMVTTPLRLLPYPVALGVFDALALVAFAFALWIAGVRDWRIYCIACGSFPVVSGLILGQITGLIALGYALAWRYRSRTLVVGLLVGLLIALKLLAWPLIIWLALTRRGRSAAVAAGASVALILLSWAVIDFQGLTSFPRLLRLSANSWAPRTYSVKAAALAAGIAPTMSLALCLVIGGLLCAWAIRAAVGRHDFASFAAAVAAGIYVSPVVHPHYVMCFVALVAFIQPRPHWIWLALIGLWISPREPAYSSWQLAVELALSLGLVAFVILPRPQPEARAGLMPRAAPVARASFS
jgi:Glycosyltransferase family 87